MNSITFDTHRFVKKLVAKKITEEQAEIIIETIKEAVEAKNDILATKKDVNELELKIAHIETNLIKYMFTGFIAVIGLLFAVLFKLN